MRSASPDASASSRADRWASTSARQAEVSKTGTAVRCMSSGLAALQQFLGVADQLVSDHLGVDLVAAVADGLLDLGAFLLVDDAIAMENVSKVKQAIDDGSYQVD